MKTDVSSTADWEFRIFVGIRFNAVVNIEFVVLAELAQGRSQLACGDCVSGSDHE